MKRVNHIVPTLLLLTILAVSSCNSCRNTSPRNTEDFNFDWAFTLGDNPAYSTPDFNDTTWRKLHLPHDWSIEGEFDQNNPSTYSGGALPGGIGWYRKHFNVSDTTSRYTVEFDGVFMNSTVYVNGNLQNVLWSNETPLKFARPYCVPDQTIPLLSWKKLNTISPLSSLVNEAWGLAMAETDASIKKLSNSVFRRFQD